jgi:glycosyltransferase involved in cell wall biosynthesis
MFFRHALPFLAFYKTRRINFSFFDWDYSLSRFSGPVREMSLSSQRSGPVVSIIVRTYRGREGLLRQALESINRQTWEDLDVVIVEDGGQTMKGVVGEIPWRPGITVQYRAMEKVGRCRTGNEGLSLARGAWCCFLDDDDLLFADHVETLMQRAIETNLDGVFSLAWEVQTDLVDKSLPLYSEVEYALKHTESSFDGTILFNNVAAIQSVIFSKALFERLGGLESELDNLEDWDMWARYWASGARFGHVPKITSMYRVPSDPALRHRRLLDLDSYYDMALRRLGAYQKTTRLLDLRNMFSQALRHDPRIIPNTIRFRRRIRFLSWMSRGLIEGMVNALFSVEYYSIRGGTIDVGLMQLFETRCALVTWKSWIERFVEFRAIHSCDIKLDGDKIFIQGVGVDPHFSIADSLLAGASGSEHEFHILMIEMRAESPDSIQVFWTSDGVFTQEACHQENYSKGVGRFFISIPKHTSQVRIDPGWKTGSWIMTRLELR